VGHFHRAAAGIDHIERLGRRSSPVHSLSAAAKLAVTMLFIVLVVSVSQGAPDELVPFVFYPAVMMSLSGTPYRPLLSRLAAALPFALAVGLSNMALLREGAFSVGGFVVTLGMVSFAAIMLKTALCVFAVLILIATTPFTEIAALLTAPRPLRIVGLHIVLTYRYIATLLGEAGDMWTAYMLRSPGVKALKMKDMGPFLGQLLLRSFDKAERVYHAMKCRGFSGVYRSAVAPARLAGADGIFLCACALSLCALRLCRTSLLLGTLLSAPSN
jgi:cobalt/nickel transport system permease protein